MWSTNSLPNPTLPHSTPIDPTDSVKHPIIPSKNSSNSPKPITRIRSQSPPMPGSIQVSVLDFTELPSTSNSVKLSMGKVVYEAREKGSFYFPLTNLRDNLIITVLDSEGNQVSQSGVRTVSIIEKGVWDDEFRIDGGGIIHLKLQFFLSDEERNRIRKMRELAIKKKQDEILGSRNEVSDVLRASSSQESQKSGAKNDISLKASESFDETKEESLQRQSFTNVPDKREGTSTSQRPQYIRQKSNSLNDLVEKFYDQTLTEKIPSDVKERIEENTSDKNNAMLLPQAESPEKLLEDTETRVLLKTNAVKSEPSDHPVENIDKQIIDDKNRSFVKKMSKGSKFPSLFKETELKTVNRLQDTDLAKRLKDSSSGDVGSSRLTVSEKIKSFSPKLAGEIDKQDPTEKTPQSIKKMISVFESTISQDRVLLKPASTKPYRFGTSWPSKDNTVKDDYEQLEKSGSSRLRSSFSTGDLRKDLSNIITKGDQVDLDNNFVEPTENMQSKGSNPEGAEKITKESVNNNEKLPKSSHEGVNNDKESIDGRMTSKDYLDNFDQDGSGQRIFLDEKRQVWMTPQDDQEKIVASIPDDVAKGEEIDGSESADVEASNGSFGQVLKIALVVGFGVLVLLFRQKESGKRKNKESANASRNQVFMNKRRSIEEQGRRVAVSRMS